MDLQELTARESIRDLVARYNSSGDSGRIDELARLFCDDATLQVGSNAPVVGREAIGEFFAQVAAGSSSDDVPRHIRHFVATHQIDLQSRSRASGRCYFQVLTHNGLDHWGRYLDEYREESGSWRLQSRRVLVDGAMPGGWGADWLS